MNQNTETNTSAERFTVTYRITVQEDSSIEEVTSDISIEQTVEIPFDCIPQDHFHDGLIGQVESCNQRGENLFDVAISYRSDIVGFSIPQFLNVLYGNISLKQGIRIIDINLPPSLSTLLRGPSWGIDGIRSLIGVYGRPLACSALKPMGLPTDQLAEMAKALALGGIDIIKDDHGIADQHFHRFEERVAKCVQAVERVNLQTGRKTLYFPSISGSFHEIERQARFAAKEGIRGVLVAPMLQGFDTLRYLSSEYNFIIMAHPALTGTFFTTPTHGMSPALLLGKLFRYIGADISVFPNWGGRFPFSQEECKELAQALREDNASLKKTFPCPAGGMNLEKLNSMGQTYGEESVFLIGGALMQQSTDLKKSASDFMSEIRSLFCEQLESPQEPFISSCSLELPSSRQTKADYFPCSQFHWQKRISQKYKLDAADFAGITRTELIGRSGESTSFDLRYFEIEPGGFSSHEKHVHEHVIIGVRGSGLLVKMQKQLSITPHDIAYVGPLEPHQLRNTGTEPFGFFCIVDHERDKPVKA